MSWKAVKIIYKAKSSVHIGHHTLGYIKLTRPYITGRAVWGAATANLTRCFGKSDGDISKQYEWFGRFLREQVIFSYFYPAFESEEPWVPRFTERGLYYSSLSYPDNALSEHHFQNCFIGSFGQTAISPNSNTAQDETLHESEFIRSQVEYRSKDGKSTREVYFVGYVFMRENKTTQNGHNVGWVKGDIPIKSAIQEIFVGGDTKYGWGRLILAESHSNPTRAYGYPLFLGDSAPKIEIESGGPIPCHLKINCQKKIKGDVEPLVWRAWNSHKKTDGINVGPGMRIESGGFYWMPGSIVQDEKPKMAVGKYGLLE